MHLVSGSLNFILPILWWWIFLSLIYFDILMWIFIQFNCWWWDELLYISNIKCEILKLSVEGITMPMINTILELRHYMWKIWAQYWHNLCVGCQYYSGANVLCVKIRTQCHWDHYAGDQYYFGAEALYVKLRQIRAQYRLDHYVGDRH